MDVNINTEVRVANMAYGAYKVVRISLSGLKDGYAVRWGDADIKRIADQAAIEIKMLGLSSKRITVKSEALVHDSRSILGVQFKTFIREDEDPMIYLEASERFLRTFCQPGRGVSQTTIGDELYVQSLSYNE